MARRVRSGYRGGRFELLEAPLELHVFVAQLFELLTEGLNFGGGLSAPAERDGPFAGGPDSPAIKFAARHVIKGAGVGRVF
jgi:hypothetical protein